MELRWDESGYVYMCIHEVKTKDNKQEHPVKSRSEQKRGSSPRTVIDLEVMPADHLRRSQ